MVARLLRAIGLSPVPLCVPGYDLARALKAMLRIRHVPERPGGFLDRGVRHQREHNRGADRWSYAYLLYLLRTGIAISTGDGRRWKRSSLTMWYCCKASGEKPESPQIPCARLGPPATARRLTPLPRASSFSFWQAAAQRALGRHELPRAAPARFSLSGDDVTPVAHDAQTMLRRLFWWLGSCVLPAMIDRQRFALSAASVSLPERLHP